jgi:hypothetical protein
MSQKGIVIDLAADSDPNITANDFAYVFHSMIGASAFAATGMTCTKQSNNLVRLSTGLFFLRGRPLTVPEGYTEDLAVDNGTVGQNRHDLVIAEFIRRVDESHDDTLRFRILKGTSTGGTPSDPALTQSPYLSGGSLHQEALFRLPITGTTLGTPVQLAPSFNFASGWMPLGAKATYASASTFTLVGDWTSVLQAKDRIMLTQSSTVKYFTVVSVAYSAPNTTVAITGVATDTLANEEILLPYFFKELPQSLPSQRTLLWSGSWAGSPTTISVPGFSNYRYFEVSFGEVRALGIRSNTYFFAGLPFMSSAVQEALSFYCTYSGDVLTWGAALRLTHPVSASHGGGTSQTLQGIYGIS